GCVRRRRPGSSLRVEAPDRVGEHVLGARRAQPRVVAGNVAWRALRPAERAEAHPGARLAILPGVQARLPAGALHRRRLVVAPAAEDDPGLLLDLQRAACEGRPAAPARVRRRLASLSLREG